MRYLAAMAFMAAGVTYLSAQKVTSNDRGDKIILYDDGSWRYYEPADSILEQAQMQTTAEKQNNAAKEKIDIRVNIPGTTPAKSSAPTTVTQPDRKRQVTLQDNDLLLDPPAYNCRINFNNIDEYTHKKRIDLEKEILFTYTDPQVAAYFKGRQYIVGEAYLSEYVGDLRYLVMRITINSKTARAEYGYLKSGTLMAVKLLDGETVSLFSSSSDVGIIDDPNNLTSFKVAFPVSRENQRLLQRSLVDKVRITWSTGYEEYDVFNLDFFQNQLSCLNKM